MESATVKYVSIENIRRSGLKYTDVELTVFAKNGYTRMLVVRATGNASGFAQKLLVGGKVSIIYPGEEKVSGTCVYVTVETRKDGNKPWNDFKSYKIIGVNNNQ